MKHKFNIKCIKPEGWFVEHILQEATFVPDDYFYYGPFRTRAKVRRVQRELKKVFYAVDSMTN